MSVRAKMAVVSITDFGASVAKTVKFETRYDDSIPEDQRFLKATPWSHCEMQVDNPLALKQLTIGQAFYVDFSAVPAPADQQ